MIVEREDLKKTLYKILRAHRPTTGYANFDPLHSDDNYEPTELMKEREAKAKPFKVWDKSAPQDRLRDLHRLTIWTISLMSLWSCTETDISAMTRLS